MTVETTPKYVLWYNDYEVFADDQRVVHEPGSGFHSWNDTIDKDMTKRDWKSLVRNGQNATTFLSCVTKEVETASSNFYRRVRRDVPSQFEANLWEYHRTGDYLRVDPFSGVASLSVDSARNQALVRFYSNLASVDTKFKGMVTTGELRESLTMIRHPARALRKGLADYLTQIKRFGRIRRESRQSAVRATWLEYSYGWRPIVSDIDNAITAFYSSDLVKPIFEMVRGYGEDDDASLYDTLFLSPVTGSTFKVDVVQRQRVRVKIYGIHHSSGNGSPNLHHYGFRPSEFVPTLWELIPYSFVVDYFTNIGNILESWSYRFIQTAFASQTIVTELERKFENPLITYEKFPGWTDEVLTAIPGLSRALNRTINRTPAIVLELPSVELKVPGKWSQWMNLAALATLRDEARAALAR